VAAVPARATGSAATTATDARADTMNHLRRHFTAFAASLVATLAVTSAHAQPQADFVLGVSDGSYSGLDNARVAAKYSGLADTLGRALRRKVVVVVARESATLDDGIRSGRFDLVLARASDTPARALRDHGYQFVASARPDAQCLLITAKDSPLKTIEQARGARWAFPEKDSYTARLCSAELRERGIDTAREKVQYLKEQDAVSFYLQNKFSDVGAIVSYSGAAASLEGAGHVVLHKGVAQPYFPLVAGRRVTSDLLRAVQAELNLLPQADAGRELLRTLGIQSFDTTSGDRLRALPDWLGGLLPASAPSR
jgi:phosphonate transport system substrate-binding protein